MKPFTYLLVIAYSTVSYAADEITMHIECTPNSAGCVQMTSIGDNTQEWVEEAPAITISNGEVKDVYVDASEYGIPGLRVQLNDTQSTKLFELTKNNVGRNLAIVLNGKILTSPNIREGISGGTFQLSMGAGNDKFWEKVPWLTERLSIRNDETKRATAINLSLYIGLVVLGLLGSVVYAFSRRTKA